MQMSAMKVCFQIAECSFSAAKVLFYFGKCKEFDGIFGNEKDKTKRCILDHSTIK